LLLNRITVDSSLIPIQGIGTRHFPNAVASRRFEPEVQLNRG